MTDYVYKARDRHGLLTAGRLEAESQRAAALKLEKEGFIPVSIEVEERSIIAAQLEKWFSSLQTVKTEDLIVFTRQLASTLEAGVPLISSLEAVAEQIRNAKFRTVVFRVKKDIEEGSTFSDALEKHRRIFSPLVISMVRAGEKAGILHQVLDRLSALLEKDLETVEKVRAATRYPIIVVVVLGIAFVVMSVYIIPRFASFFASFKMELPLPTRILIGVEYVIRHFWYWLAGVAILGAWAARKILQTEKGRLGFDRVLLSLPVFGALFLKINLSRFGRMLAAMLASGIPILESLTITADTVDNKVISGVILHLRSEVHRGTGLAEPMRGSKFFPPISISMVAIGEKAGSLENMLNKMADYFDREIDYTIKNLTPLLEPILIFVLGILVLIFALGVYLPMWNLINIYKSF